MLDEKEAEKHSFEPLDFGEPDYIEIVFKAYIEDDIRDVGRLYIENDTLKFDGNIHETAKILFEQALKPLVECYLKSKE